MRSLTRANTGTHRVRCIDRYGEVGFVLRAVVTHHQWYAQLSRALCGDRHANQTASLTGEEVDNLWRDFLGSNYEVSLVFPVLIIHEDDHLTFANVVQNIWNGIEGHLNSPALTRSFTAFL